MLSWFAISVDMGLQYTVYKSAGENLEHEELRLLFLFRFVVVIVVVLLRRRRRRQRTKGGRSCRGGADYSGRRRVQGRPHFCLLVLAAACLLLQLAAACLLLQLAAAT